MQRLLPTLLCGVLLLSTTAETVLANHDVGRRRAPGFFERLFGVRPRVQRPPRVVRQNNFASGFVDDEFEDPKPRKRFLFGNRPKKVVRNKPEKKVAIFKPRQATGPRIISPPKKVIAVKKAPTVAIVEDPEDLPTLGMGNLPYIPPKEVLLFNAFAANYPASTSQALAIRDVFASRDGALKAEAPLVEAIFKHYAVRSYEPMWIKDGAFTDRAKLVVSQLAKAEVDGLHKSNYLPFGFTDFDVSSLGVPSDLAMQARLDIGFSIAALKFAQHISGGQFEPKRLSLYYDIKPEGVDLETALRVLTFSPFPDQYLANIAPQHEQYKLLKDELALLQSGVDKVVFSDVEKAIKKGQREPQISKLRERLLEEGYLAPTEALVAEVDKDLLDDALSKALKAFQGIEKIKVTSALDQATIKKLNEDRTQGRVEKLVINLERARWLPKNLGKRHVLVNQAGYELGVFENKKRIWTSRVIVGRPMTQTNVFNDRMENIVFNPQWGMPASILVNEYRKKLISNPGYFDKIGYKVYDADGEIVPSKKIQWSKYGNKIPYTVVQPPGEGNALGELKFNFPNAHAIYMHDTPDHSLFDRSARAFSHGCVRVNNPREFARVLLGWDESKIKDTIDAAETVSTTVDNPTDVYLHYFTAWPTETGKIRYHSDIYERDKTLLQALEMSQKRAENRQKVKIVAAGSVSGEIKAD